MASVVLTAIGDDQAGLVDALSRVIADHGGSWQESHMAQLAGKFAGIVVAVVPDANVDALVLALDPLEARGLLDITVEVADHGAGVSTTPDTTRPSRFALELVGQDRLGIIADLSSALAAIDVSIDELHTETRDAPMAGGVLFEAQAELAAPAATTIEALTIALETLRDEFMIELAPQAMR